MGKDRLFRRARSARTHALNADMAEGGHPMIRRFAASTAVLVFLPALVVGLAAGTAGASGAGTITNHTGTGVDAPDGIAAGPNGALWFANFGNSSIGEVTTTGTVSNFTGTGIDEPIGITAGPDGNLWFTNQGNNSIGSIT